MTDYFYLVVITILVSFFWLLALRKKDKAEITSENEELVIWGEPGSNGLFQHGKLKLKDNRLSLVNGQGETIFDEAVEDVSLSLNGLLLRTWWKFVLPTGAELQIEMRVGLGAFNYWSIASRNQKWIDRLKGVAVVQVSSTASPSFTKTMFGISLGLFAILIFVAVSAFSGR